jgi:hypothetical protein
LEKGKENMTRRCTAQGTQQENQLVTGKEHRATHHGQSTTSDKQPATGNLQPMMQNEARMTDDG